MSKNNIVIAVVVLLVVVGVGLYFNKTKDMSDYSIVYLTTKEVYVGKLTTFPDLQLSGGYILNTVADATDPKKTNFQLTPMSEALWAPEKSIHLVKDNVVFYGALSDTSSIAKTLAEKAKN